MVGPDFQKPEVQVESAWIESGDARVKTETRDYRNWWETFNDPVLNRLVDRAYDENLSLKIAGVSAPRRGPLRSEATFLCLL